MVKLMINDDGYRYGIGATYGNYIKLFGTTNYTFSLQHSDCII